MPLQVVLVGLDSGSYTLAVRAVDAAGNVGEPSTVYPFLVRVGGACLVEGEGAISSAAMRQRHCVHVPRAVCVCAVQPSISVGCGAWSWVETMHNVARQVAMAA